MDMLLQTYNTFFGNKIYCLRLSCLNYKFRKDILLLKTCVTSGYFCHTDHAVPFPQPANIETESHPVKANQKCSVWHISCCHVFACK